MSLISRSEDEVLALLENAAKTLARYSEEIARLQEKIKNAIDNKQVPLTATVFQKPTFYDIIEEFRQGERKIEDWNFCIQEENGKFTAYIMGEGAEQCLARLADVNKSVVKDLFHSLGVKHIRSGIG